MVGSMSYQTYNFLHLIGVIATFMGIGALLARAALAPNNRTMRVWGAVVAGVGLLLLLVAGFGMQAKGPYGWPVWMLAKIVLWVLLGGMLALINRKPKWNSLFWIAVFILAVAAVWLGVFKPTIT